MDPVTLVIGDNRWPHDVIHNPTLNKHERNNGDIREVTESVFEIALQAWSDKQFNFFISAFEETGEKIY